jgi:hypothetical protein
MFFNTRPFFCASIESRSRRRKAFFMGSRKVKAPASEPVVVAASAKDPSTQAVDEQQASAHRRKGIRDSYKRFAANAPSVTETTGGGKTTLGS